MFLHYIPYKYTKVHQNMVLTADVEFRFCILSMREKCEVWTSGIPNKRSGCYL